MGELTHRTACPDEHRPRSRQSSSDACTSSFTVAGARARAGRCRIDADDLRRCVSIRRRHRTCGGVQAAGHSTTAKSSIADDTSGYLINAPLVVGCFWLVHPAPDCGPAGRGHTNRRIRCTSMIVVRPTAQRVLVGCQGHRLGGADICGKFGVGLPRTTDTPCGGVLLQ
jgi:hypothetical protein